MSDNRLTLGSALRELRLAKGIQQKEIVNRIPHRYSTERTYRRVESDERLPDRDALIDIAINGLQETVVENVDRLLGLAGYSGLSVAEREQLKLRSPALPESSSNRESSVCAITVVSLAALSIVITTAVNGLPIWFGLLTSALYGALYAVSILLESAYGALTAVGKRAAAYAFGFILLTSVGALALLAQLTGMGKPEGLWLSLATFVGAAVIQWVRFRRVLPTESVVEATFSSLTAQAAHLKNTVYFLTAVALFWVPPAHSVLLLNRELRLGNRQLVARVLQEGGLSSGLWHPRPAWLWILLLVILGLTLAMGAHLLDSLRPNPNRNRFLILFYARALLYFALTFVCVVWYSSALDDIERLLAQTP